MLEYLPDMFKAPGTRECHEAWVRDRGAQRRGSLGQSQSLTGQVASLAAFGSTMAYEGGPIVSFLSMLSQI